MPCAGGLVAARVFVDVLVTSAGLRLVSLDSAASEAGHPQDDEHEPEYPDWNPDPRDQKEK
jgi:hypothetical protein